MRNKLCILVLCVLSSCSNVERVDTACDWVRPIYIGNDDTLSKITASEILAHNQKWLHNCKNDKNS